jgi:Ca2+/Na+ antiporter
MSSDVAMVKRGYGEMAITATVAGPLFNTLIGLGMALVLSITSAKDP